MVITDTAYVSQLHHLLTIFLIRSMILHFMSKSSAYFFLPVLKHTWPKFMHDQKKSFA